eukprot:5885072-Alexandrium_andersonii.AAC.1
MYALPLSHALARGQQETWGRCVREAVEARCSSVDWCVCPQAGQPGEIKKRKGEGTHEQALVCLGKS